MCHSELTCIVTMGREREKEREAGKETHAGCSHNRTEPKEKERGGGELRSRG